MLKIFIDSNIFLFGYRINESNSFILLENIDGELTQPVVSRGIIEEVRIRAKKLEGKDTASLIILNILTLPNISVVQDHEIIPLLHEYDDLVSDKSDLPHICAYFVGNCEYFVTNNRKLTQQRIKDKVSFINPKEFVDNILKLKSFDTPKGI
jgi:predicted nucleic acid-binding protein